MDVAAMSRKEKTPDLHFCGQGRECSSVYDFYRVYTFIEDSRFLRKGVAISRDRAASRAFIYDFAPVQGFPD
jgi:hypothetical protein